MIKFIFIHYRINNIWSSFLILLFYFFWHTNDSWALRIPSANCIISGCLQQHDRRLIGPLCLASFGGIHVHWHRPTLHSPFFTFWIIFPCFYFVFFVAVKIAATLSTVCFPWCPMRGRESMSKSRNFIRQVSNMR
jgi:hypothetical protein